MKITVKRYHNSNRPKSRYLMCNTAYFESFDFSYMFWPSKK